MTTCLRQMNMCQCYVAFIKGYEWDLAMHFHQHAICKYNKTGNITKQVASKGLQATSYATLTV